MKQRIAFTLMMSFVLSVLMTCWITFLNLGFTDEFFLRWFNAWVLAWPAAFVIAFVTGPTIQKLSMRFK
ncbi:MAG: hypothetical protein COB09_00940 [Thalassobium sp.]|uniref:DUF2798 domain-containing protein n=1 Tax=Thalassolituus pacificus TaxID=2975440 RepID=A0A9X3AJL6_9GAMM|nr:DUF2798 domain-containing protein [Thalassolituus pacificus]MCT7360616.1 DUF2798 domain-containing protein [Thalassolituus pacificus]PHS66067.1 MAG: hypothetical protein COB09_00940 [Thalassobium sp.]